MAREGASIISLISRLRRGVKTLVLRLVATKLYSGRAARCVKSPAIDRSRLESWHNSQKAAPTLDPNMW
jgi:hypothetical protein